MESNPPHVAAFFPFFKGKPTGAILWTVGQGLQESTAPSQSTQCEMRS